MPTKIQTYDLALESVQQDGDTYRLPSSPAISFHTEEGRVTVEGYGSLKLKDEYGTTHLVASNSGGRRVLKSSGDARRAEEIRKVRTRIRALLSHAGADFMEFRA